mgnify:CR=1 FL=1
MNLGILFVAQLFQTVRVYCLQGASMDPAGSQTPVRGSGRDQRSEMVGTRPEPRTRDLGTGWVHRDVYKAIYTSRFEELCDNQGTKIYLLVQENRLGGDAHAYSEGIMS